MIFTRPGRRIRPCSSAAGLPLRPQQHVDGVDLWPQWRGQAGPARGPIYWHYPHYSNQGGTPGASVRDGDLKLIRWFEDGRQALYNLADDIEERHDLAAAQPEQVNRLAKLLDAWSEDVVALIPRPNPTPYFAP